MFRSGAARGVLRSLNTTSQPAFRAVNAPLRTQFKSQLCTVARRPQTLAAVKPVSILAFQSKRAASDVKSTLDKIDIKHEAEVAKDKLKAVPELVSSASSIHPVLGEVGLKEEPHETEMLGGVKHDLAVIRDTFSLENVPREAYLIGLAGLLPYVATSLSTFYCAWEIQHSHAHGTGLLLSDKTAEALLHVLEPLQVGYGAMIISFLGAIHWGLEFAKFGGTHGYSRYLTGVLATGLAWPTTLLPVETALISQFLLFTFLYYNDSRATKRGWAPAWYGVYRFVLTFIVGSAIVVSLIGRGQVQEHVSRPSGTAERIQKLRDSQFEQLEEEEGARRKYLASADEEDEEEAEEDDE